MTSFTCMRVSKCACVMFFIAILSNGSAEVSDLAAHFADAFPAIARELKVAFAADQCCPLRYINDAALSPA